MRSESMVIVEAHRSAATLYATGNLTTKALLEIVARAHQLPNNIRAVCIDLSGARQPDSHALRVLELGLAPWRAYRHGLSRVKVPKRADSSVITLDFTGERPTARVAPQPTMRGAFGLRSGTTGSPS